MTKTTGKLQLASHSAWIKGDSQAPCLLDGQMQLGHGVIEQA